MGIASRLLHTVFHSQSNSATYSTFADIVRVYKFYLLTYLFTYLHLLTVHALLLNLWSQLDDTEWSLQFLQRPHYVTGCVEFSCRQSAALSERWTPWATIRDAQNTLNSDGVVSNFHLGAIVPGAWERKSPSGVQGRGPVESPQKLKQFADTVYRFRLQEGSIFWKYRTIHLLILDQCVSLWEEAKQHLGVKPPCLLHSGQWRI